MLRRTTWSVAALTAATLGFATAASAVPAAPPVALSVMPITSSLTTKNARTTITLKNTTKRRLTGLSVTVGTRKGVRVTVAGAKRGSQSRRLKPLAAGRAVRLTVRLRRTSKGPKAGNLSVRARRNGKSVATGRLVFGRTAKPKPVPATMTGRYFWGSSYIGSIQQHTLYFTGPSFVFTGDLKGTWPTCTTVTKDCRPYTFDPKTGALVIDGRAAKVEGTKLTVDDSDPNDGAIDGQTHRELGRPAAGTRWDIVLTYSNSVGLCPLYCSYSTEHMTFRPDGTFIRSSVNSGTGPVVDWVVVPDDSKGTYDIRADRTLRLAFADGTERIETLGLYPEDDNSYPSNPTAGVVLDSDGYFDIRD